MAGQLLKNFNELLQNCRNISVPVPWGKVNGIEIGPKDGIPVVMIHGWLDNCHSFVPLLTKLPLNRRYIALDLPGHGHSSHLPTSYDSALIKSVPTMELIRKGLEIDKMILIGHSMGGVISCLYSATYPENIIKTVAIDGVFTRLSSNSEVVKNLRKASDDHVRDAYTHTIYPDVDSLAITKSKTPWYKGLDLELSKLIIQRNTTSCDGGIKQRYDPKLRYSSLSYLTKEQFMEFCKSWEKPLLHIEADQGALAIVPFLQGTSKMLQQLNENFSYVVIPGPHHIHMANCGRTSELIVNFIDDVQ